MKKQFLRFALITVALIIAVNIAFSCAAVRYYTYAVNEDFSSRGAFLAPGDVNGDGDFSGSDLSQLINVLLGRGSGVYTDVTGDGAVSLKDLVRAKTNISTAFVSGGKMNLKGNSVYSGDFIAKLNPGVTYKVSCKYKSDAAIKIKINGVGDSKEYTLNATSGSYITFEQTFNTPYGISEPDGINLQIIGTATVDSFVIEQLNTDNDYSVG